MHSIRRTKEQQALAESQAMQNRGGMFGGVYVAPEDMNRQQRRAHKAQQRRK